MMGVFVQIRMDQDNGLRQGIRNLLAAGGIRHGYYLLPQQLQYNEGI